MPNPLPLLPAISRMRGLSFFSCWPAMYLASALASPNVSVKSRSLTETSSPGPVTPRCSAFHSSSVKSALVAIDPPRSGSSRECRRALRAPRHPARTKEDEASAILLRGVSQERIRDIVARGTSTRSLSPREHPKENAHANHTQRAGHDSRPSRLVQRVRLHRHDRGGPATRRRRRPLHPRRPHRVAHTPERPDDLRDGGGRAPPAPRRARRGDP